MTATTDREVANSESHRASVVVRRRRRLVASKASSSPSLSGSSRTFLLQRVQPAMTGLIDGSLSTRTDGLSQQLQRNQKDQDNLNTRLAGIEQRMRAQYTALDTRMASLTTQSSYITQQIATWNKA